MRPSAWFPFCSPARLGYPDMRITFIHGRRSPSARATSKPFPSGHDDVGNQQIDRSFILVRDLNRLVRVSRHEHFVAGVRQVIPQQTANTLMIFHQQ